jgi:hypothetical protein
MFDSIKNKFQFRFKDRTYAANILAAALEDLLGKKILNALWPRASNHKGVYAYMNTG